MAEEYSPTRREALRRGALVAGATVWAAPAVQTLAAPAFAAGSPVGENPCTGCLTGGGQIITKVTFEGVEAEVSLGLSPICCGEEPKPGTELEVNVHKVDDPSSEDLSYHFDKNLVVTCIRDNSCDAGQPAYCANRFVGTIQDAAGNTLLFDLTDCGEGAGQDPVDRVSLTIQDSSSATVVSAVGLADRGNLQAHATLGPIERVCNC